MHFNFQPSILKNYDNTRKNRDNRRRGRLIARTIQEKEEND
jgi:hypothetical protein